MIGTLPRWFILTTSITLACLVNSAPARAGAIQYLPLTDTGDLGHMDDGSSPAVNLNIGGAGGLNFFGQYFTQVYVNNNGNLTFGSAYSTFTPSGLSTGVGMPIIAPFFADVDTSAAGSGTVQYGYGMVDGRLAFVANYINVGYYGSHTDKLNSFQAMLIDRSDAAAGDFDIVFNYDVMLWETGDASGGSGGLGGTSAVVGYSNGLDPNVYYQLPGSLVNGALIDGGPNSLVSGTLGGSGIPGRYEFQVRSGVIQPEPDPVPEPSTSMLLLGGGAVLAAFSRMKK
jgi:hypothetical protein